MKNDNNFNGYFLYCGKTDSKLNNDNEMNSIKKVDIDKHSFVFYPKSSKSMGKFFFRSLRLQFFTWVAMKKVAIVLSQKSWTIHINVDDISLQEEIEELRSVRSIADGQFWDEVAYLIIKNNSVWPTKIMAEPTTQVRLVFIPPFSEENIEIRYGENIYLYDTFFNEKFEKLKVFLETYLTSTKEEIAV